MQDAMREVRCNGPQQLKIQMSDPKKEILDYLRNQQKSAEIEAKVNGINIWVLLAAIAVIAWQTLQAAAAASPPLILILKFLTITSAIHFFLYSINPDSGHRDELRYSSSRETPGSWFLLMQGIWQTAPALGVIVFSKAPPSTFIILIFGGLFTAHAFIEVIKDAFKESNNSTGRFPKPNFSANKTSTTRVQLSFALIFAYVIYNQSATLIYDPTAFEFKELQTCLLASALYMLITTALVRKRRSHGIDWSYVLERDLVLNHISPDAALRRIENRSFGPKLQDVMDSFFSELDSDFTELTKLRNDASKKMIELEQIPKIYAAERSTRTTEIRKNFDKKMSLISSKCKELFEYIEKLKLRNMDKALLRSLTDRHSKYINALSDEKFEVNIFLRKLERNNGGSNETGLLDTSKTS